MTQQYVKIPVNPGADYDAKIERMARAIAWADLQITDMQASESSRLELLEEFWPEFVLHAQAAWEAAQEG